MTARSYVTMWCNGVDDEGQRCPMWEDNGSRTAAEARKYVASIGWLVALPGGRDLCPHHRDQKRSRSGG